MAERRLRHCMEFSTNYPTYLLPRREARWSLVPLMNMTGYTTTHIYGHRWEGEAKTHLLNLYHSSAHCDNPCWPGNSWLAKHDCHWTKEENVLSHTLWTNNLAEIVVGGITSYVNLVVHGTSPLPLATSRLCSQTSVFCASSPDVVQCEVILHLDFKWAGNAISQWLEGSTPFYFWLSCLLICSALKFDPSQHLTRFA